MGRLPARDGETKGESRWHVALPTVWEVGAWHSFPLCAPGSPRSARSCSGARSPVPTTHARAHTATRTHAHRHPHTRSLTAAFLGTRTATAVSQRSSWPRGSRVAGSPARLWLESFERKGLSAGRSAKAGPQWPASTWRSGGVGKSPVSRSPLEFVSARLLCPAVTALSGQGARPCPLPQGSAHRGLRRGVSGNDGRASPCPGGGWGRASVSVSGLVGEQTSR